MVWTRHIEEAVRGGIMVSVVPSKGEDLKACIVRGVNMLIFGKDMYEAEVCC